MATHERAGIGDRQRYSRTGWLARHWNLHATLCEQEADCIAHANSLGVEIRRSVGRNSRMHILPSPESPCERLSCSSKYIHLSV